jgi:hypothetical protein
MEGVTRDASASVSAPAPARSVAPGSNDPDAGWTHVRSKRRRNQAVATPGPSLQGEPTEIEPRTASSKTVPEMHDEYARISSQWEGQAARNALLEIVRANAKRSPRISRAICLGIGTFDPENGGWEAKRRAYLQLAAFTTIVACLCECKSSPDSRRRNPAR